MDTREPRARARVALSGLTIAEYFRDKQDGIDTPIPKNYFPEDKPELAPQNYWRPFAYLLCANWLNDLYQNTMFDLTQLQDDK